MKLELFTGWILTLERCEKIYLDETSPITMPFLSWSNEEVNVQISSMNGQIIIDIDIISDKLNCIVYGRQVS